jgi:hypothetical protein
VRRGPPDDRRAADDSDFTSQQGGDKIFHRRVRISCAVRGGRPFIRSVSVSTGGTMGCDRTRTFIFLVYIKLGAMGRQIRKLVTPFVFGVPGVPADPLKGNIMFFNQA